MQVPAKDAILSSEKYFTKGEAAMEDIQFKIRKSLLVNKTNKNEKINLVWMWIKQGKLTLGQFKILLDEEVI